MGAGASTLTEDKVKDIIDEEVDLSSYAKNIDLANYKKTTELKGYLDPLYLDESDKAALTTGNDNDTKWVTPQYVTTKIGSGNINTSTVSTFLASSPQFSKTFRDTVVNDNTFQGNLATSLAGSNDFIGGIYAKFNTAGTENVFRNNLKDSIIAGLKVDTTFIESARGPRGADGSLNDESLKASLWNGTGTGQGNKVMWCADGELCKVPVSKKGVEFTSGEQVIRGYGDPQVVRIDNHLGIKQDGSIDFARNRITSGLGSLGTEDAVIKSYIQNNTNPTSTDIDNSHLSITGIGRMKNDNRRSTKKIKMEDDVTVTGGLTVGGDVRVGGRLLLPNEWIIQTGGNTLDIKKRVSDTQEDILIRMYDTTNGQRLIVFRDGDGLPPFAFIGGSKNDQAWEPGVTGNWDWRKATAGNKTSSNQKTLS